MGLGLGLTHYWTRQNFNLSANKVPIHREIKLKASNVLLDLELNARLVRVRFHTGLNHQP